MVSLSFEKELLQKTINYLKTKNKVLLITTSTRWNNKKEKPKSSQLAEIIAAQLNGKATIIDASALNIYPCEGNVSTAKGNTCGQKEAVLTDKEKNPSWQHRCWSSFNNKDDELWKISRELLQSDCVVFFTSIRWGQTNSCYQKLIERLTWLENMHTTLGETNLLEKIDAGIIAVGHNWRGKEVVDVQKQVLDFFGFNVPNELCWNWQFTKDEKDESEESYSKSYEKFKQTFLGDILFRTFKTKKSTQEIKEELKKGWN